MRLSFLVLPLLFMAVVVLAACGGADDGVSAAQIAESALLEVADLPGEGWAQGPDQVGDGDDGFLAAPSCGSLRRVVETFGGDDSGPQVERAREFQRSDAGAFIQVESGVSVYASPIDFSTGEAEARRLLASSQTVEDCFREGLQTAFAEPDAPPATLTSVDVIDIVPLIDDSFAFAVAIEAEIFAEGFTFPVGFTFEVHEIVRGRLVGELQVVQGNTDALNADLPEVALAFAVRMLAAQAR